MNVIYTMFISCVYYIGFLFCSCLAILYAYTYCHVYMTYCKILCYYCVMNCACAVALIAGRLYSVAVVEVPVCIQYIILQVGGVLVKQ